MSIEKRFFELTYKEVAEALVKKLDLHEGQWGVAAKFGIGAINGPGPEAKTVPIAMVPVLGIGLRSFDKPNDMTVDAAEVNPSCHSSKTPYKPSKKRRSRARH